MKECRMEYSLQELERAALEVRINLLKLCKKETIHIGGDLSIADIMTALWLTQIKYDPQSVDNEDRDRFVLSKGHASAVTSFCQAMIGCFSAEDVITEYATDQGRFSMHSCNLVNPYVEVSTGSLGHGMPVACGMAVGLRLKGNKSSRVYTVMGDGEQAEGSIWEAAANAAHYGLGNLVAIIDYNGLEADGRIEDITSMADIGRKYCSFGWKVFEIDGNDMSQVVKTFADLPGIESDTSCCIVAHTVKGKGVSFMENDARWHAGKISVSQFEECVTDLRSSFERRWSV